MKLAIISPYPPSKGTLNEYAFHLVKSFHQKEEIKEIIILTDKIEGGYPEEIENDNYKVKIVPCWSFNSFFTLFNIIKHLVKFKADVAFFNIQFLSFGDKKIPAAIGLLTPLVSRLIRIPSVTLLHNITETVDYQSAGITESKVLAFIYNLIGTSLTRILLFSNILAVTMPKYVRILEKKYKVSNVALVPHGSFELPPLPDFKSQSKLSVMTFGKFGTYKKVEGMIEAVEIVRQRTGLNIEIKIAGSDNPNVKGYLEGVKEKYNHVKDLVFTGYVAEEEVPIIFKESTVVVFPYTSTTGSSGVLHQAGSYGKAVVLPNIGDLKELIEEEGYRGEYFEPEDVAGLATAIQKLITDEAYCAQLGKTNYLAAASLPMVDIADWYLLHFKAFSTVKEAIKADQNIEGKTVFEEAQLFV